MLTAIWHMGSTTTPYRDPGGDYFNRLHPDRAKSRALHQLQALGYYVTLNRVGGLQLPATRGIFASEVGEVQ
jgi:hypothetical protein